MPFHVPAIAAAALGFAGAQDCSNPTEQTISEDENDFDPTNGGAAAPASPMAGSVASGFIEDKNPKGRVHLSERQLRFSGRIAGNDGVRSMYSERPSNNAHRHMEVRLRVRRRINIVLFVGNKNTSR